jgi:hypothetical protein
VANTRAAPPERLAPGIAAGEHAARAGTPAQLSDRLATG